MKIIVAESIEIKHVPTVTGLPPGVYLEYFGRLGVEDAEPFLIIRPRDDWDYTDWVVLMGDPLKVVEQTKPVVRFRDGGTTHVFTTRGMFLFPTPFEVSLKPTFNGMGITVYERPDQSRSESKELR